MKLALTDIPTDTGRPKLPNPLMPVAEAAVKARDKGKAVVLIPADEKDLTDLSLDYVERKLRECGKDLSVTISIRRQDMEGDKVALIVFAKDQIKRERKPKAAPETAPETSPESGTDGAAK